MDRSILDYLLSLLSLDPRSNPMGTAPNEGNPVMQAAQEAMASPLAQDILRYVSYTDAPDDMFRVGISPLVETGRLAAGSGSAEELVRSLANAANPGMAVGQQLGTALAGGQPYDPLASFGMAGDIAAGVANPITFGVPAPGATTRTAREAAGFLSQETAERLAGTPGLRKVADSDHIPTVDRSFGRSARDPSQYTPGNQAIYDNLSQALNRYFNFDEFQRVFNEGVERGGDRWYLGSELQDLFKEAVGDAQGEEMYRVFHHLSAVTSANTTITENIRRATDLMAEAFSGKSFREIAEEIDAGKAAGTPVEGVTGGKLGLFNARAIENVMESGEIGGQKVTSYNANHLGVDDAVTVDIHNARMMFHLMGMDWRSESGRKAISDVLGLPAGIEADPKKWSEAMYSKIASGAGYHALEDFQKGLAQQMGVSPRELQAILWVGGQEITNVSSVATFPSLVMQRLESVAARYGRPINQMLKDLYDGNLKLGDLFSPEEQRSLLRASRGVSFDDEQDEAEGEELLNLGLELGGYTTGGRF